MTISIVPKSKSLTELEMPNGFKNAILITTPILSLLKDKSKEEGKDDLEFSSFSNENALKMHEILTEYVKTDKYLNHTYFSIRQNQMESFLEFLPGCDGFTIE